MNLYSFKMTVYICLKYFITLKLDLKFASYSFIHTSCDLKWLYTNLASPFKAWVKLLGYPSFLFLLAHCHGSWFQKPPDFLL